MKQTYDIESIVYQDLKKNQALTDELNGGIYLGQRPLNSDKEDVVISTIALTQEFKPQLATTNINVHVADKTVAIGGIQQKVEDRVRLKQLSALVLSAIRSSSIQGIKIVVENQSTLTEPDISQHFVNIRINWIIH
jgi:hypothetical protein